MGTIVCKQASISLWLRATIKSVDQMHVRIDDDRKFWKMCLIFVHSRFRACIFEKKTEIKFIFLLQETPERAADIRKSSSQESTNWISNWKNDEPQHLYIRKKKNPRPTHNNPSNYLLFPCGVKDRRKTHTKLNG